MNQIRTKDFDTGVSDSRRLLRTALPRGQVQFKLSHRSDLVNFSFYVVKTAFSEHTFLCRLFSIVINRAQREDRTKNKILLFPGTFVSPHTNKLISNEITETNN